MGEKKIMTETIEMRALRWATSGDTGTSSLTIMRHMLGLPHDDGFGVSEPSDGSDLGRCMRLLRAVPEWQPRMPEMAPLSHTWAALVPHWETLAALLESEIGPDLPWHGSSPRTNKRIREIIDAARQKDGWVSFGKGASVRFR